jgi:Smg protein
VGFESEEIEDALNWLDGLAQGTQVAAQAQSARGVRVYTDAERELLGEESIGFISFLESSGVLAPSMREMVLDRAKAADEAPIDLEHLKVIVLMVFWSVGEEPDALILDELSINAEQRSIH